MLRAGDGGTSQGKQAGSPRGPLETSLGGGGRGREEMKKAGAASKMRREGGPWREKLTDRHRPRRQEESEGQERQGEGRGAGGSRKLQCKGRELQREGLGVVSGSRGQRKRHRQKEGVTGGKKQETEKRSGNWGSAGRSRLL